MVIALAGCSSAPAPLPGPVKVLTAEPETTTVEIEQPAAVTQGIAEDQIILSQQIDSESPWELVYRADQSPTDIATELRMAAIDGFIEIQDYTSAETQANYLLDVYLDVVQKVQFNLQRGRIAQGLGQHQIAIQYLNPLQNDPSLDFIARALVLQVLSEAHLSLNLRVDALVNLLQRDAILGYDLQLPNQLHIINLLRTLSSLEQSLLRQSATNNGFSANLIDGWLAFAEIASLPEVQQQASLFGWHNSFPNHPARDQLIGSKISIPLDRFNHIALLLPLTSPFGNAAQAFYDGFIDAYNEDNNVYKPAVSLHDIGQDTGLVSFYYQSAMNEGADFIVGPLGRGAVNALLHNQPLQLPTLVLADVEPANSAPNLYGISLSPELEATQVAERAFADGHRQAAIVGSASPWGQRAAEAFGNTWLELGGSIVSNKTFPDTVDDYSRIVQQLLEVNQSVARERVLSAQLGVNLKFNSRRRDDFDLLFLAANSQQARLLVPQLRFFRAHNLPIYATSNIFSGRVNPAVDADLDKLIFGDMHWMLDIRYEIPNEDLTQDALENSEIPGTELIEQPTNDVTLLEGYTTATATALDGTTDGAVENIPETTTEAGNDPAIDPSIESASVAEPEPQLVAKSLYSFTALDRLYALGLESYHLIPRLSVLRRDNWQRYNGQAFKASIRSDGNILRHLDWATFENGQITLLDQVVTDVIPEPPGQ